MTRLADQIVQNERQAATTQQTLRNRRVVRHRTDPDDDDPPSVVIREPSSLPVTLAARPMLSEAPTASTAHSAITLSPLDLPAEQFKDGLDRRKANRHVLMEWLRTALVEGVDYGRIHVVGKSHCRFASMGRMKDCADDSHWSKPSLFKPGAEKISGMLGMSAHYPSLAAYETAVLAQIEIKTILLRCELHDAQGRVVAEGVGARNLSQDYGDLNKSLKMAEKSAHIDATLRLAGLSEVFTQDLEDRPPPVEAETEPVDASGEPPIAPRQTKGNEKTAKKGASASRSPSVEVELPTESTEAIDRKDLADVRERMRRFGFTEPRVLSWLYKTTQGTVTRLEQLSMTQCVSLLKKLDQWAEAEKTLAQGKAAEGRS